MQYFFGQGGLDSLCGVYAIVNAEKIVNSSSDKISQELFNEIIIYLSKKRILRDVVINGLSHRTMLQIIDNVVGDRIPVKITNRKNINKLLEWWKLSRDHMQQPNSAIILSIGGREEHYTTIQYITDKTIGLVEAGWTGKTWVIRKRDCKMKGYAGKDKYVIYPSQCWYLSKEE